MRGDDYRPSHGSAGQSRLDVLRPRDNRPQEHDILVIIYPDAGDAPAITKTRGRGPRRPWGATARK
jgi:hypothetical protein